MKACPFCAEEIQDAAVVCKHCGRDLKIGASQVQLVQKKTTSPLAWGCLAVVIGFVVLAGWCGSIISSTLAPQASRPSAPSAIRSVASPAPPQLPAESLALLAARGYESETGNYWYVEGQVKNITDQPLKNVEAVAEWFDKSGTFVKSDSAIIEYNPLLPGQTSPFKTISTGNPVMSRFTIDFKTFFGSAIRTRDDRKTSKKP